MVTPLLVHDWFTQVWNNSNSNAIDDMMHPDVVIHGLHPGEAVQGIDNFKEFYQGFRAVFPTVDVKAEPLVSDGESVAAHCIVKATTADGKQVEFFGLCVTRYNENNLIVEGWNCFDFLSMQQQLGKVRVIESAEV